MHPSDFLEKALVFAEQQGIDYDMCYPQLDCVMSYVLPLMRQGRLFGYIRMYGTGEMSFEAIGYRQPAAGLTMVA